MQIYTFSKFLRDNDNAAWNLEIHVVNDACKNAMYRAILCHAL